MLRYASHRETYDEKKEPPKHRHQYHFTPIQCPSDGPKCLNKQGKRNEITVFGEDLHEYHNGKHIQAAFPYLSADDRELLMSGICKPCFEDMINEEEY